MKCEGVCVCVFELDETACGYFPFGIASADIQIYLLEIVSRREYAA